MNGNGSTSDIRLEKCLEAVYDQMLSSLPQKLRNKCPAVKCVETMLAALKAETTAEIAIEMGLVENARWKCPCRK